MSGLTRRQSRLFDAHLRWAEGVGRSTAGKLPDCFDVNEMEQAGRIGLMKAVRAGYDPKRGVPFVGFAHPYVQGECWMAIRRREYVERTHAEIKHDPPGGKRPDEQVACEARNAELHTALARLTTIQRKIVVQQFWFSQSLSNLAQTLEMPQAEVASARRDAMDTLATALRVDPEWSRPRAKLRRELWAALQRYEEELA